MWIIVIIVIVIIITVMKIIIIFIDGSHVTTKVIFQWATEN